MDLWQETNWFAVQAKSFREKLAACTVAKFNVEVFLPEIRQDQLVCGVWRAVTKPLFPGYFFARFCPLALLDAVRRARGVLRVVGISRVPIPIESGIIESIQERVQSDGFVQVERQRLQPGDSVTIEQGPLAGGMGKVERELNDGKRVLILLEAIQQARVLIEQRWLAAVPAAI